MSRDKLHKPHWNLFAYLETCCVDHKGVVDPQRVNEADLDGIDELEDTGLLEHTGTGIHPRVKLTDLGWALASQLRQHKARGGQFGDFSPSWPAA